MNKLEQLKQYSTVVADTGDIDAIKKFSPLDATTNPSLMLKASQLPQYQALIEQACIFAQKHQSPSLAADKFATLIGKEISQIIKGWVSTEVDARLSFDSKATIEKARTLIALYDDIGVHKNRVLIKIAATWEGIKAAEILQKEGINCNLTLLFSLEQAQACADAGATLISPFVGRITDWHKAQTGRDNYAAIEDPGVLSVKAIYQHYKSHNYSTIVMGASFRNVRQIEALAGCDRLTISPALLEELSQYQGQLQQALSVDMNSNEENNSLSEAQFRLALNNNAMANDKLAEGIRLFIKDQETLENTLHGKIKQA